MKPEFSDMVISDLTNTHYVQLDGLRGLAITMVMTYHFLLPHPGVYSNHSNLLLQFAQGGWTGVDLFFVLSGFLISNILIETREGENYFRNFFVRRSLRIWPLYYLSLVGLLLVLPAAMSSPTIALQSMIDKQAWFWLYGANWLFALQGSFEQTSGGYFWSLAVEEQFYVTWPIVVYFFPNRRLLVVCSLILCVSLISRLILLQHNISPVTLYTMTFTHLDGLVIGSGLAVCLRSKLLAARARKMLPMVATSALAGLFAVRLVDGDLFYWSPTMATYGYTVLALMFGCLLLWSISGDPRRGIRRVFSSGIMSNIGRYSYALYLVHVPIATLMFPLIFRVLERISPGATYESKFAAYFVVSFAASWSVSMASWHILEKRILSLKRRFSYSHSNIGKKQA